MKRISERMLRKWRKRRKNALSITNHSETINSSNELVPIVLYQADKILQLTQELLDQHLINKE